MPKAKKTQRTGAHKLSPETDLDMPAVMAAMPELTIHGFGVVRSWPRTPFEEARADLLSAHSLRQFEIAKHWLRACRPSGDSYGLKHDAERSIGYLTNGVFIAAAKAVGCSLRPTWPESLNAKLSWPENRRQRIGVPKRQ